MPGIVGIRNRVSKVRASEQFITCIALFAVALAKVDLICREIKMDIVFRPEIFRIFVDPMLKLKFFRH